MKKIFFSAVALATVVTPMATVISCGKHSKELRSNAGGSNNLSQPNPSNTPIAEDIIPLDLLEKIDTTPYSVESLKAEALKIGNDAIWKRGLPFEAATQAISTLRALAEYAGYDETKQYLQMDDFAVVDENNNVTMPIQSSMNANEKDNQLKFIDVVKKLKEATRTKAEQNESALTIGTIDNDTISLKTAGVDGATDSELDWSQGKSDYLIKGSQVFAYNDYKHPGDKIIQFVNYTNKVVKFIRVKDGNQLYPIIKKEDEEQFKPYVEGLFQKFINAFVSASSMLSVAGYPTEQQSVVLFVRDHFCATQTIDDEDTYVFNMKQSDFDNFWNQFNNGSHNIEALKLLLIGLDNSFASSNDMIDMTRNSQSDSINGDVKTEINSSLDGALKMNDMMGALQFLDWIYESRYVSNIGHTYYNVSKTLEENIKDFTGDDKATTLPKA